MGSPKLEHHLPGEVPGLALSGSSGPWGSPSIFQQLGGDGLRQLCATTSSLPVSISSWTVLEEFDAMILEAALDLGLGWIGDKTFPVEQYKREKKVKYSISLWIGQ